MLLEASDMARRSAFVTLPSNLYIVAVKRSLANAAFEGAFRTKFALSDMLLDSSRILLHPLMDKL